MVLQNRTAVVGMFGAVLASLFFFVTPSHAEIVYKDIYVYMVDKGTYSFDLNGDGITDFTLTMTLHQVGCPYYITAVETPAQGNGAESTALPAGTQIGPNEQFPEKALGMANFNYLCGGHWSYAGPWPQGQKRYLGLMFLIDGQPHYGWAAVEFDVILTFGPPKLIAKLTGYAYESVEGMPINAGQTQ
jgi:hypothetical protein